MAKVTLEVEFSLDDYFTKFGFNDGNGGAEESQGYDHMFRAIRILNHKFRMHELPLEADSYEVGSCHNNCRIKIDKVGPDAEEDIYTDEDDLDCLPEHGINIAAFKRAFQEASDWFDAAVEGSRETPEDTKPDCSTDDPLEDR